MNALIDWNDRKAFLAVLEGGSLSAAGRTLGLSQPTVRGRIEALEKALGAVLFTRSAQGLLPTDVAWSLGDHVRAMANASEAFLRAASAPPGEVAGAVRISVGEFVGVEVLPPMLARLRVAHPGLTVGLVLDNAPANLSEQEVDIAVRTHAPTQDTLVQRKVGEIALSFFASRDYPARRGVPQDLADLAEHDLIGPDRARSVLQQAQAMLPPAVMARVVLHTDSHPVAIAAARAGVGIAVVHRPVGLADPVLLPVLPEQVFRRLPIHIVAHRDLRDVPRVRAAFDHLADEFARYARG